MQILQEQKSALSPTDRLLFNGLLKSIDFFRDRPT